jgi:hypothetical protein
MPLSKGAIQKRVDRVSEAIVPHNNLIGQVARSATVKHIDAISWFTQCPMATEHPTVGQWRVWHARFSHLIASTTAR